MFYLIGLGLGDATDITVKGLRALERCSRVYLEAYTSVLTVGKEALVSRSRTHRECSSASSFTRTRQRCVQNGELLIGFKS